MGRWARPINAVRAPAGRTAGSVGPQRLRLTNRALARVAEPEWPRSVLRPASIFSRSDLRRINTRSSAGFKSLTVVHPLIIIALRYSFVLTVALDQPACG